MSKPWIALAFVLLSALAGCRHTPDEEQVRKAIAATVAGAESAKASDAVEALTDDFDGNSGELDKRALANLVRVYALRGQSIHVLMGPTSIERRGERLVATFTATLTAGTGVLPDNA